MNKKVKKIINIILIIFFIGLIYYLMSIVFWGSISISGDLQTGCLNVKKIKNPLFEEGMSQLKSGQVSYSLFGENDGNIYNMVAGEDGHSCSKIENIDVDTFKVLSRFHAKDKNHAYIIVHNDMKNGFYILSGIDSDTYEADEVGQFSKDKNHVYDGNQILEGIDPNTFKFKKYQFEDGIVGKPL